MNQGQVHNFSMFRLFISISKNSKSIFLQLGLNLLISECEQSLTQEDLDNGCICKKNNRKCPQSPAGCGLSEAEEQAGCTCKKGNKKCPPSPADCGLTETDVQSGCFCKKGKPKCPNGGGNNNDCNLSADDIAQGCTCKKGNKKCPSGGVLFTCHGTCQCTEKKDKQKVLSCDPCPQNCTCGKKIKCF